MHNVVVSNVTLLVDSEQKIRTRPQLDALLHSINTRLTKEQDAPCIVLSEDFKMKGDVENERLTF